MIKEYIKGSILDAPQKYIAHGVNCQNVMGSGVARVLFEKYPKVRQDYHRQTRNSYAKLRNVDTSKILGNIELSNYGGDKEVLNMYTQNFYGYDGKKYVSYDAIYDCFKGLVSRGYEEVAIPKIGCGLAGGNWDIVSRIIDDATGDDLDVYVYYLEQK